MLCSGVKPVDKREGAGSRNWGTYKDDLEYVDTVFWVRVHYSGPSRFQLLTRVRISCSYFKPAAEGCRFVGPQWYEICPGSGIGGSGGPYESDGEEAGVPCLKPQQPHCRRFLRHPGLQSCCHHSIHGMEGGLGGKSTRREWPHDNNGGA